MKSKFFSVDISVVLLNVIGYAQMMEAENDEIFVYLNSTETGPQRQTACEQETPAE